MADISKITLPNGNTYNIKDAEARAAIEAFSGGNAVVFMGVSSTPLTDGGTENPTIDSTAITDKAAGQLYFYNTQEYIWGKDNKWHELGSLDSLGALAYKNTVKYDKATSVSYTNTNSTKTINLTGTSSAVTITATDNTNGNYQPKGTISQPTFSNGTISGSTTITADGTVSKPTFTGTKISGQTVSAATSGTATYTPGGTVGTPTISIRTAGSTTTIKNPTSATVAKTVVAAAPGATAPSNNLTYYSVTDETLSLYQLGYTTGASITTSNVTVKNGDAEYQSTQPS